MILFELTGDENHRFYQQLEIANGNRQYDFLRSIVVASLQIGRGFLSQHLIKALNFQAITCLHTNAGEYRPCEVKVGDYQPVEPYRVQAAMDDFVNRVNFSWQNADPVVLSAYVLWRLNNIHPFINGNGRTARAAAYFVLCVKAGGWLPGAVILPELLRRNRDEYVAALKVADRPAPDGSPNLSNLHAMISRLLGEQLAPANADPSPNDGSGAAPDPSDTP